MRTSIVSGSDTVQIIAPTEVTDPYGSTRFSWSSPTLVAEGKATIQHFMASEDDDDRQTTIEGLRLISDDPALFNFDAKHRVLYAGRTYEVDGEIQQWRFFSRVHHVEVYLRRVVG